MWIVVLQLERDDLLEQAYYGPYATQEEAKAAANDPLLFNVCDWDVAVAELKGPPSREEGGR